MQTATLLAATAAGCALGTASGLLPGLHANNLALLLAAAAPSVPAPPLALGAAMLAAGVVHTFLDVVPSLVLGVPDAAMAAAALPGHRLVLGGRGREALRLSAVGSGVALAVAVPAAVPITAVAVRVYPRVRPWLPILLAGVAALLVVSEHSNRRRAVACVALALSGLLGTVAPSDPAAPVAAGGTLTPLFAGLFGAPVLLDALGGSGVPEQADPRLALPSRPLGHAAVAGTGAGAAVGYLPGVSAGVAATLSLPATAGEDPAREYVVASSGANTATAVFALFAFTALGTPRSGVLVAMETAGVPAALGPLLVVTVVAGSVGTVGVLVAGDAALRVVARVNHTRLVAVVFCGLLALSWLFAGWVGIVVFGAATLVGLVPPRLGCRRVHLMGVLLVPIAVGG